jgi:hypothetical protein
MNRARIIFYSVFAAYHLIAFVFTLWISYTTSTTNLFKLLGYIGAFKYITFLGLLMIITDFVWLRIDLRNQKKELEAARVENNTLKAKVYDFQESTKVKPEVKAPR